MSRTFILAALLAATFATAAQAATWERSGITNTYHDPVMVDTDTLRRTPTGWIYWVSVPMRKPSSHVSVVTRVEADCGEGRTRMLSDMTVYRGLSGVGPDLVDTIPASRAWSYPVPDSITALVMETVCKGGK